MTRFLLDVNVLVALVDTDHVHHDRSHEWFGELGDTEWLSCPTTQNGAVRVVSGPKYINGPVRVNDALESVRSITEQGNHVFVSDSISLLDESHFDSRHLLASSQITDVYLLALSAFHQSTFVTFDKRIRTSAVVSEAKSILTLI
jgi:toxin-antitoxin system PIN domain toxin